MAIPKIIEELAHKVRTEIYGRDVREALATSMEATAEVAEWSREVAQQIIDGSFDEGELNTEIERKLNELEQQYAPRLTSIETEIEDARGGETNLGDRLNEFSSQLAGKPNREDIDYWYKPDNIPNCRSDLPNYWFDAFRDDSVVAYNKVDEIMSLYGTRANKTLLGQDQSNQYDIYRYQFTPPNYTKTIIIDSAIHGGEVTSFLMTALFLRDMVQRKDEVPILNELFNNVRFIYTPIANPYGFNANNGQPTGRLRQNSRQVDLNRNFSYLFDEQGDSSPGDLDYKGTEPFSEKESQYIRDTLQTYNDAIAYFNVHNTGTPDYDVYVPYPQNMEPKGFANLIKEWTKNIENPVINHNQSTASSSPNYAYNIEGIIANGIEWSDRKFGPAFSKEDLTKAVEWFGNAVIQHYLLYDKKSNIHEISYRKNNETLLVNPTGYWNPVTALKGSTKSYGEGVAKLTVVIKVKANANGTLNINGMLGQGGNGTGLLYGDRQDKWLTRLNLTENEERQITIICTIPVKKTTIGAQVTDVGWGINAFAEDASFEILEYNAILEFIYTENSLKSVNSTIV